MYYLIGFFIALVLSIFINNKEKGVFTGLYHLYFSVGVTFFFSNIELIYISFCYLIIDLFVQYFCKTLSKFTFIHHIMSILTAIFLFSIPEITYLANFATILEASNIVLDLSALGIISDRLKKILFPIVFIIARFIIFNIQMYNNIVFGTYIHIIISLLCFFNLINIYIVLMVVKKYLYKAKSN